MELLADIERGHYCVYQDMLIATHGGEAQQQQ